MGPKWRSIGGKGRSEVEAMRGETMQKEWQWMDDEGIKERATWLAARGEERCKEKRCRKEVEEKLKRREEMKNRG